MDLPHPPRVSIIVPARNEEACLGLCLGSLTGQEGLSFEIIVVDDGSIDGTRGIAGSFPCVQVIKAGPLPANWTGKNHALALGADVARGKWLLFTDADTVHAAGSLAKAVAEAEGNGASLLSYSPKQEVRSFWEKAVMPVIFAELAAAYRPSEVSDPKSGAAAANGQYVLISRESYEAIGGYTALSTNLLEDVALARAVKAAGRKISFRYGGEAVRTRMYRSFVQLREGWTKNLVLLFPYSIRLASLRFSEFTLIVGSFVAALIMVTLGVVLPAYALFGFGLLAYLRFLTRVRRAHFSWSANVLAIFGLPLFSYLLLRSKSRHARGKVTWKGRSYNPCHNSMAATGHVGTAVPGYPAEHGPVNSYS